MRKLLVPVVLSLASAGLPSQVYAEPVQFSATRVQTLPQDKIMTSKMYVGDQVMRTEVTYEGQTRITIVNRKERLAWMINPAKKEYVEMREPAPSGQSSSSRAPLPDEPGSPCLDKREDFQCRKLAEETVNGRRVQKWQFVTTQQGKTLQSLVWIDTALRMPVRQEFPGGMVSELRDIKEGPQPAGLFTLPDGYTKIDMPAPSQGYGGRGGGGKVR